jgi:hypothetical protein
VRVNETTRTFVLIFDLLNSNKAYTGAQTRSTVSPIGAGKSSSGAAPTASSATHQKSCRASSAVKLLYHLSHDRLSESSSAVQGVSMLSACHAS